MLLTLGTLGTLETNPKRKHTPPEISIGVGESNERCINYIRYPRQHDLRCSRLLFEPGLRLKVVLSARSGLAKGLGLCLGLGHNLKRALRGVEMGWGRGG